MLISWALPLLSLGMLLWTAYTSRKRGPVMATINAVIVAAIALFLCRGNVDWLGTVPIYLWWLIVLVAGFAVAYGATGASERGR